MPTTELKLLLLLCYLISFGPTITVAATITAKNTDKLISGFGNYFACEAAGTNPKCDSIKTALQTLGAYEIWTTVHALIGLFPVLNLLYAVNFGAIQEKFAHLWLFLRAHLLTGVKDCTAKEPDSKI